MKLIQLIFTGFCLIGFVVSHYGIAGVFGFNMTERDFSGSRQNMAEVKISDVEEVGITKATISGKVVQDGGNKITERGICWNREGKPTVDDSVVTEGKGVGAFVCKLNNLTKATVYHARAFAVHDNGVAYGKEISFTTHAFANGVKIPLKYLKGGTFQMGATQNPEISYGDEFPVHQVTVDGFQISQYEITSRQYCAFLNDRDIKENGSHRNVLYIDVPDSDCPIRYSGSKFVPEKGKGDYPVTEVTWFGARAFCKWLGGRLPTEAEWEFAARGGKQSRDYQYSGGNQLEKVGWYKDNSGGHVHPVGQKAPNGMGLYDMSGNVWEWCRDYYSFDYYSKSPRENPSGPAEGNSRVMRGGAWNMDQWNCRVSNRSNKNPDFTYNYFGFRLVIPD